MKTTKTKKMTRVAKLTIREFAAGASGISPAMRQIAIAVAAERLREDHGIQVSEERLARLV